jgi:hypothetical protein
VSGVVALGSALDHVVEVYGRGPEGTISKET